MTAAMMKNSEQHQTQYLNSLSMFRDLFNLFDRALVNFSTIASNIYVCVASTFDIT